MPDLGPVTCVGCGLLCDDVMVQRADDVVRVTPECRLGAEWFAARVDRSVTPPATLRGRPADVEKALARAAELLRGARRPLLHGFDAATVEDTRAAVALADRLGALIAMDGASDAWPGAPAVPLRGASSATLGEIRDRSRLVVIWREDPERTHPRLLERLGLGPQSAGRTLVVVDDRDTATAARADVRLRWPRERDLEALVTLHALQRALTLDPGDLGTDLTELVQRVTAVPHAAFVYGPGLTEGEGGQRRVLALLELVRALCSDRHVVTLELPRAAGTRAAQDVLAWQTGYAGPVDLARGHPELVTATGPLADAEAVDVSLRVEGGPARLPAGVAEIALGALGGVPDGPAVEVSIRTAAAGVEASGTVHRLDGVPLTLQAPVSSDAPTAAALLQRLLEEMER